MRSDHVPAIGRKEVAAVPLRDRDVKVIAHRFGHDLVELSLGQDRRRERVPDQLPFDVFGG
jgi:hypothetical protein